MDGVTTSAAPAAPPVRHTRGWRAAPTVGLLAAAGLSVVAAAAVYLLLVHTVLGQRLDNAALAGSYQQLPRTRFGDVDQLQRISADSFLVVLLVIAAIGVLRRRPLLGLTTAVAAAVSVIGVDVVKSSLLTRPALVHSDSLLTANTFPSGHAATAISCALALVVVAPVRLRGVAAVAAGSYGWLTAAQVQTAGWHRLSDAIGAAFVSFAVMCLATAVLSRTRPVVRRPVRHPVSLLVLAIVWLGAAGAGALQTARVLRYLMSHLDSFALTATVRSDAYHISVDLTVVVVVSLLIALLALLSGWELDQRRPRTTAAGPDEPAPLLSRAEPS